MSAARDAPRVKPVFVDTGAWIALAIVRDPLHERAVEIWENLRAQGARAHTSVPVILETFTFLERNTSRAVALRWRDTLADVPRLRTLGLAAADLDETFAWFKRRDLHKLSAVDASSFVLMLRSAIRTAFTFDHHFAAAGFLLAD